MAGWLGAMLLGCAGGRGDDPAQESATGAGCADLVHVAGDQTFDTDPSMAGFCDRGNAVDGNVLIQGTVTSLEPLSCLCEVTGSFTVWTTSGLETLGGLRNLRSVDALYILSNYGLRRADGPALTEVRIVEFTQNYELESVEGLTIADDTERFTVGGELDSLSPLSGHPSLGDVSVSASKLKDLDDFAGVTHATSLLLGVPALRDVSGLADLREVDGSLELGGLTHLETLDLPVERIGGGLLISGSPSLLSLSFPALTELGVLNLADNDGLVSPGSFPEVTSIDGLFLQGNERLTTMSGLDGVTAIDGDVYVEANEVLRDLGGIGQVDTVDGNVLFRANPSLPEAEIEAWIDSVGPDDIGGSVYDTGNG